MSRTDAHCPLWVRLARGDLAVEAQHASGHSVCDLPQRPPTTAPATKCRWVFRYTGTNICSCWMCHGGPMNRQETRDQRHRDRVTLRAALERWNHGDQSAFDDLAVVVLLLLW